MPNKPKTTQPETPNDVQGRDMFQTPRYGINLLIPFIPKYINTIWECAVGEGKIFSALENDRFAVYGSDIRQTNWADKIINFVNNDKIPENVFQRLSSGVQENLAIITNPPFSTKYKFIFKAIEYNLPFAFLIPFDMCQKMAILFDKYNCQGIVPTSRINYITPTGKSESTGHSSYYHSFWICRYFNLEKQLIFVDLTKEMRKNI